MIFKKNRYIMLSFDLMIESLLYFSVAKLKWIIKFTVKSFRAYKISIAVETT